MKYILYLILTVFLMPVAASAQQRVGINTTEPVRQLEIKGAGAQYLRIHTNDPTRIVGIEWMRGNDISGARDWRLRNSSGNLLLSTSSDNFVADEDIPFRIQNLSHVGFGTQNPVTRLHVDDGEEASNSTDGILLLGAKTGFNLAMDDDEIIARNNGSPANLFIQTGGGDTWFGDGNVIIGGNQGRMVVGTSPMNARVNVNGGSYQVSLRNSLNGTNDWFIGASDATWLTGDDYLLFSPTTAHLHATLRLKNVTENNGSEAPVIIASPNSQRLLLDGNEIDSESTPLYINQNSEHHTLINPWGGRVGVGTNNPDGLLHIQGTDFGLGLSENLSTWWITPTVASNLNFYRNTSLLAYVSYAGGGEWVAVSDRNLKTGIRPLESTLASIRQLGLYRYGYTYGPPEFRDIGVIAQEVDTLFPEAVSQDERQYAVSYDQLTVVAIRGLQEQHAQLTGLLEQADALLRDLGSQK